MNFSNSNSLINGGRHYINIKLIWMLLGGMAGLLAAAGCVVVDEDIGWTEKDAKPVMSLVPGVSEERAVFMGFDFDAPVEWEQGIMSAIVTYSDRCEYFNYVRRHCKLSPQWNGFDEVLVWGDWKGEIVEGLLFERKMPRDSKLGPWLADVMQVLLSDCGMALSFCPQESTGGWLVYKGRKGMLEVRLSAGPLQQRDKDGNLICDLQVCRLDLRRCGVIAPAPI